MTAINFPAGAASGATHTEAGITWTFDGTTWDTTGVGYVAKGGDTMTGNLTVPSLNGGQLAGFRNILINGDMRINQRKIAITAAAPGPYGPYGPDRWKKVDATNMTQVVESGNFIPGAKYTLSGTGVTTQQLTAPASGDWTLPNIPNTATNIQLELGTVATPFERRPIGLELLLCQRYFYLRPMVATETVGVAVGYDGTHAYDGIGQLFPVMMRAAPTSAVHGAMNITDGRASSTAQLLRYLMHTSVNGFWGGFEGSGIVAGTDYFVRSTTTADLIFNAEL